MKPRRIRGDLKMEDKKKLEAEIQKILEEKVNPTLAAHFGGAILTELDDEGTAWIKMTGACASCGSAQETIENVVGEALKAACPYVKDVALDNSVSEDILEMARKILNKEL